MAVGGLRAGGGPPVGSRLQEGIITCCVSPHERPLWGHLILAYGNGETRSGGDRCRWHGDPAGVRFPAHCLAGRQRRLLCDTCPASPLHVAGGSSLSLPPSPPLKVMPTASSTRILRTRFSWDQPQGGFGWPHISVFQHCCSHLMHSALAGFWGCGVFSWGSCYR